MIATRRLGTGLVALVAAGVLAACSGGTSGSTEQTSAAESAAASAVASATAAASSAPAAGGDVTIGVSFYTTQLPMYIEIKEGIEAKAAEMGAKVEFTDGGGDAQRQINQIESLITSGVNAILVSPVDATALVPAYKSAQEAGIPIFSVANKVDDQYESGFVGPDLADYATQTMDRLVECMGGKGDLVVITGPPAISFVQLQQKGWDKSLATHPDVKVVQTLVDDDMSTAKAVDLTNSALTANPNVKGIMTSIDNIGVGSAQAVESQGMKAGDICIAGWDGQPNAIEAVKSGFYTLTLSYMGYKWGQIAAQTAIDAANGTMPAAHYVLTDGLFIDSSNASTLTPDQIMGKS